MIKKILIPLGVSLLFCITPTLSNAQHGQRGVRQQGKSVVQQQKHSQRLAEKRALSSKKSDLYADGFTVEEKEQVANAILEREIAEVFRAEQLEYPAIDLYGENTWNKSVNPFGRIVADIPASYDIDCSGFVMPLEKIHVTSNFGYRKRFKRNHYGIDLGLSIGDTVRACFDGRVRIQEYNRGGYGNYVVIRHPNGLETVYGHLNRALVKEDQIVLAGTPIGLGGNTGRSTGPHLHLEMRFMGIPLDPASIIDFKEGYPKRDYYTFRHHGGAVLHAQKDNHSTDDTKQKVYKRAKGSASARNHIVRKGDSLYTIAKKYGTTVTNICKVNKMSSKSTLKPGQKLLIH